jgi:hypothetical protein
VVAGTATTKKPTAPKGDEGPLESR